MMSFGSRADGGDYYPYSSDLADSVPPYAMDQSVHQPLTAPTPEFNGSYYNYNYSSFHPSYLIPHKPIWCPEMQPTYFPSTSRHAPLQMSGSPTNHMSPSEYAASDAFSLRTNLDGSANQDVNIKPSYTPYTPLYGRGPGFGLFHGSSHYGYSSGYTWPEQMDGRNSMWGDGMAAYEQGHYSRLSGGLGSEEENQDALARYHDFTSGLGSHASEGLSRCENSSYRSDMLSSKGKDIPSSGTEQPDSRCFLNKHNNILPANHLGTPISESTSILPDLDPTKPFPDHVSASMNSVPRFPLVLPFHNTCSSAMKTSSSNNVVGHSGEVDTNYVATNQHIGATCPLLDPEKEDHSASDVHFEGNVNDHARSYHSDKGLPSNRSVYKNAPHNLFGLESSQVYHCSSLGFGNGGVLNVAKHSHETSDLHNLPVDSPCSGASLSKCLLPDIRELTTAEILKFNRSQEMYKPKGFNGLHFLGPQLFPENTDDVLLGPIQDLLSAEDNYPDQVSKRALCPDSLSKENRAHNVAGAESVNTHPTLSSAAESSKSIQEKQKQHVHSNCLINKPEPKQSPEVQPVFRQDDKMSEKSYGLDAGLGDVRTKANYVSDPGLSHVPLHAMRHFSSSSSEFIPAMHSELHDEIAPPNLNVLSLVDSVRNISKLLLHECANKRIELTEDDYKTLKESVDDLNKCIGGTSGQKIPTGSPILSQPASSVSVSSSANLYQGANKTNSQVAESEITSIPKLPNGQHQGERGKRCNEYCDTGLVNNDMMTQDIMNILASSFPDEGELQPQALLYKKLWLEAEAALCSKTCISRFNQMKARMETHEAHLIKENSTDEKSSHFKTYAEPSTVTKLEPGINEGLTEDAKSVSQCKTSTDPSTVTKLKPGMNEGLTADSPDPTVGSSSYEDDVMERLRILVNRADNPNSAKAKDAACSSDKAVPNAEEKLGSVASNGQIPYTSNRGMEDVMASFELLTFQSDKENPENAVNVTGLEPTAGSDKVDAPLSQQKHSPNAATLVQDLLMSSVARHLDGGEASVNSFVSTPARLSNDFEASVMARFHILKSRAVNPNSTDYEPEQSLPGIDMGPILRNVVVGRSLHKEFYSSPEDMSSPQSPTLSDMMSPRRNQEFYPSPEGTSSPQSPTLSDMMSPRRTQEFCPSPECTSSPQSPTLSDIISPRRIEELYLSPEDMIPPRSPSPGDMIPLQWTDKCYPSLEDMLSVQSHSSENMIPPRRIEEFYPSMEDVIPLRTPCPGDMIPPQRTGIDRTKVLGCGYHSSSDWEYV